MTVPPSSFPPPVAPPGPQPRERRPATLSWIALGVAALTILVGTAVLVVPRMLGVSDAVVRGSAGWAPWVLGLIAVGLGIAALVRRCRARGAAIAAIVAPAAFCAIVVAVFALYALFLVVGLVVGAS